MERVVAETAERRTPSRTPPTHLGNGRVRAFTDRRNDQITAFAALSEFATAVVGKMALATKQRKLATTAVVHNVAVTESPTKKIVRLTILRDAASDSNTKNRY